MNLCLIRVTLVAFFHLKQTQYYLKLLEPLLCLLIPQPYDGFYIYRVLVVTGNTFQFLFR
jgi:hypothetical protein